MFSEGETPSETSPPMFSEGETPSETPPMFSEGETPSETSPRNVLRGGDPDNQYSVPGHTGLLHLPNVSFTSLP
jgi:hypothetical protein